MNELRLVTNVFTVLGQDVVRNHVADLIIEIPRAVETLSKGKPCTILCRESGADNIDRFRGCIESEEDGDKRVITDEECIAYCGKTLGWDVMTTIHPQGIVQLTRNPDGKMGVHNYTNLKYVFKMHNKDVEVIMQ